MLITPQGNKKDSIFPELQSKALQNGIAHDGPLFLRDSPTLSWIDH